MSAAITPAFTAELLDKLAIAESVQNWAPWRDAGDWERFAQVWHSDGWMSATWFQGPAHRFIEVSRTGFEAGVSILHFLGGTSIDLQGRRAVAQTKMTINQRALVDGHQVDVVCTGRFYDFFEKRVVDGGESWRIVRRQPIYEKDRMDPTDPSVSLKLDPAVLQRYPDGYRHLAYLQAGLGFKVKVDMPGLRGPIVEALYARGRQWLAGAASAFDEPPVESGL
ncbi:MAG: nuclear transport factor 2 family protein [Burkholderiales bacterium]|nr:nuclear transport factor 2 family protein [Burkholderiales bacterium]